MRRRCFAARDAYFAAAMPARCYYACRRRQRGDTAVRFAAMILTPIYAGDMPTACRRLCRAVAAP